MSDAAPPGPIPAMVPPASRPPGAGRSAPNGPPPAANPPAASRLPDRRSPTAVLTAFGLLLLLGGLLWIWQEQQSLAARIGDPAEVTLLREQVRALQQRLAQLEQRPPPAAAAVDLRPVEARLAALEQRPVGTAPAAVDPGLARRVAGIVQLQRAAAALAAGERLGEIAGAPAALSRFATVAPPSEAALRLDFPAASRLAELASRPAADAPGVGERVWHRLRGLVTVRDGDTVLLGAPAVVVLGRAGELLNAGDLAGAVAALAALDPAAAAAIAAWRERAASLLAARAALAVMLAE